MLLLKYLWTKNHSFLTKAWILLADVSKNPSLGQIIWGQEGNKLSWLVSAFESLSLTNPEMGPRFADICLPPNEIFNKWLCCKVYSDCFLTIPKFFSKQKLYLTFHILLDDVCSRFVDSFIALEHIFICIASILYQLAEKTNDKLISCNMFC